MDIPIGHGEVMLPPKFEARMLQELSVRKSDSVLEIGTGSGYFTALLSHRAASVTSVDIVPEFVESARRKLAAHNIRNVATAVGDASRGWSGGPYDVIAVTGSTPALPKALQGSLKPGGRLFVVVGDAPAMKAMIYVATGPGTHQATELFETVVAPLRNAQQPERFVF